MVSKGYGGASADIARPTDVSQGGFMESMEHTYEPPALTELGDFGELTQCLPSGDCPDFLGCGRAIWCI